MLSTDILESEELNPPVLTPVDSFDLPTIDESTIKGPTQLKRMKEYSSESSSRQVSDPCRISAVTSMRIGSAARPSRHRPGACSWKLSGPTMI